MRGSECPWASGLAKLIIPFPLVRKEEREEKHEKTTSLLLPQVTLMQHIHSTQSTYLAHSSPSSATCRPPPLPPPYAWVDSTLANCLKWLIVVCLFVCSAVHKHISRRSTLRMRVPVPLARCSLLLYLLLLPLLLLCICILVFAQQLCAAAAAAPVCCCCC